MIRSRALPWLLTLAVVAGYGGSLFASWQFDDWNVVVGDARVQSLVAWWNSMPGIRPLLKLSYAINHEFDAWLAMGPAGFRAFNLLLHAANALLTYRLLGRLERTWLPPKIPHLGIASLLAATIFALHPVQTESVTYISGRSNALMAALSLSSIVAWQNFAEATRHRWWWIVSVLCMAGACAVKETAIALPAALWLLHASGCAHDKRKLPAPWPHTALLLLMVVVIIASPTYRNLFSHGLGLRSISTNLLLVQPQAIFYLIGQLFDWSRLNADPLLAVAETWTIGTAIRCLVAGGLVVTGLAALRRRPWLGFGLLWFFIWLAPTNSLFPRNDVVNDRQLYLAIIGPAWLFGLLVARALQASKYSVVALAAVACVATALTAATIVRNRVYATEITFWEDVVAKTPRNARAHNNLGIALAQQCRSEAAAAAFHQAMVADATYYLATNNLALLETGQLTFANTDLLPSARCNKAP